MNRQPELLFLNRSLRSQAEVYYNTSGGFSYEGLCSDNSAIQLVNAALETVGGEVFSTTSDVTDAATNDAFIPEKRTAQCNDGPNQQYQITVPLIGDGSEELTFWCIDGMGNVGEFEDADGVDDYPFLPDQPGDGDVVCQTT